MVAGLALVVILMNEARKPENWPWFRGESGGGQAAQATPVPAKDPPFDNRPKTQATKTSPTAPIGKGVDDRYFPGVEPLLLESIQDNRTYRYDGEAWFHLLDILNRTEQSVLEAHSRGRAQYRQLTKQSNEYRGELWTIQGTIRRVVRKPARENDFGIEGFYELWCSPSDSPTWPIVIHCLYLPEGFPEGDDIYVETSVTGFYFKRWPYQSTDYAGRVAPLILARTPSWQPPPPVNDLAASDTGSGSRWLMIGLAAVFGLLAAGYVYLRTRSPRGDPSEPSPDFDQLQNVLSMPDVGPPPESPSDHATRE